MSDGPPPSKAVVDDILRLIERNPDLQGLRNKIEHCAVRSQNDHMREACIKRHRQYRFGVLRLP